MKKLFFCLLLLCSFLGASAQTAQEIIDKHIIARGGAALDSIKNAKMEIEMYHKSLPNMKTAMVYRTIMMQSHRIDMSIPNMYDGVVCFSGNQGWSSIKRGSDKPMLQAIDSAGVADLKYQTEIFGPLYHYQEKGYKVEYIGVEMVNEVPAHNIKVNAANNTIYYCYIDTATLAEIKRTVIAPSSGQIITVELYYSNIQAVNGAMIPFKVEMHNKKGVTYFDYVKITLNNAFEENLFDAPSGQ